MEEKKFNRLIVEQDSYYFSGKKAFRAEHELKSATIDRVFEFAYSMAFTDQGEHRDHRSGGMHLRRNGEIFANTFQGKIAECAVCNYFYKFDNECLPDFSISQRGIWDSVDLNVLGKEISVKSTKHFGQLILLETKDWNENGQYIPNLTEGISKYDYIILVRIDPSCEDIMRNNNLLYTDYVDKEILKNIITSQKWVYDYAGYITHDDLLYLIKEKYIIPQNAKLNGRKDMDADNYYVQAVDLRDLHTLKLDE